MRETQGLKGTAVRDDDVERVGCATQQRTLGRRVCTNARENEAGEAEQAARGQDKGL